MASATVHSVMHGVVLCGMVWGCGATCLGAAVREWRPAALATLPIHPDMHHSVGRQGGSSPHMSVLWSLSHAGDTRQHSYLLWV